MNATHSHGLEDAAQMQKEPRPPSAAIRFGEPMAADAMRSIERTLQLHHFKWDTQVGDTRIVFPQPLLIAQKEWDRLGTEAEHAAREVHALEQTIACDPTLQKLVGVPEALRKLLLPGGSADGLRTLRFDFHPTVTAGLCRKSTPTYREELVRPARCPPFSSHIAEGSPRWRAL